MDRALTVGFLIAAIALAACSDNGGVPTTTTTTIGPSETTSRPTTSAGDTTTTTTPTATTQPTATTTSTSLAATTTTTTLPPGQAMILVDEIVFAEAPYLLVSNRGGSVGSTAGMFLCQFPSYFELPAFDLAPGERIAVPLGDGEIPDLIGVIAKVEASNPIGAVSRLDGEVGLYSRSEFSSADAIINYVEWGSTAHPRSPVAVEAGVWVTGGFVEVPAEVLAIVAQVVPTTGPDDWFAEIGG